MTKRFEAGNLKIQDNAPKGRVYLLDIQGGVNALCNLINGLNDKSNRLEKENEQLKQQLQKIRDNFEVSITQNHVEFNKDKIYIKDMNTELRLNGENLFVEVYIPQIKEYYRFKYIVTGRDVMREFIKDYNLKEVHND